MPTNSCKPLTVTGCLNHVGMGGNIPSGHGNLVVSSNKVNLGEYTLTSEVGGDILYVWYWVPVRHCGIVEVPVVSARTLTPEVFGTMCCGDAQELDDLRIIPIAFMLYCRNCSRAPRALGIDTTSSLPPKQHDHLVKILLYFLQLPPLLYNKRDQKLPPSSIRRNQSHSHKRRYSKNGDFVS